MKFPRCCYIFPKLEVVEGKGEEGRQRRSPPTLFSLSLYNFKFRKDVTTSRKLRSKWRFRKYFVMVLLEQITWNRYRWRGGETEIGIQSCILLKSLHLIMFCQTDRSSTEGRKTKTKVVSLANRRQHIHKLNTQSKQEDFNSWRQPREYIEDITRWRKDLNFLFECQKNILFLPLEHKLPIFEPTCIMFFLLQGQKLQK